MDFALNIPRGTRQRDFLDYLNSALRQRTSSFSGDAGINADGLFQSTVTGPFPVGPDFAQLRWRITKDGAGALLSLDVVPANPDAQTRGWETAVTEFVTSVLAAALVERRDKFFSRTLFFYVGEQLDGEYWLRGYRFAPAFPDDTQPFLLNA